MPKKHLKKCSTSLAIREIQDKTILGYHLTRVRMAEINKAGESSYWQGCGTRRTLIHCYWKHNLVEPLWKVIW